MRVPSTAVVGYRLTPGIARQVGFAYPACVMAVDECMLQRVNYQLGTMIPKLTASVAETCRRLPGRLETDRVSATSEAPNVSQSRAK